MRAWPEACACGSAGTASHPRILASGVGVPRRHVWPGALPAIPVYACVTMADIEKRGGYVPRRTRERQAYRAVMTGSATGVAGVVTLVLSIAGFVSAAIPIILLLLTAFFVWRFLRITGQR